MTRRIGTVIITVLLTLTVAASLAVRAEVPDYGGGPAKVVIVPVGRVTAPVSTSGLQQQCDAAPIEERTCWWTSEVGSYVVDAHAVSTDGACIVDARLVCEARGALVSVATVGPEQGQRSLP